MKKILVVLAILSSFSSFAQSNYSFTYPEGLPSTPQSCILNMAGQPKVMEQDYNILFEISISCDGNPTIVYNPSQVSSTLQAVTSLEVSMNNLKLAPPTCSFAPIAFYHDHDVHDTLSTKAFCQIYPQGTALTPVQSGMPSAAASHVISRISLVGFVLLTTFLNHLAF